MTERLAHAKINLALVVGPTLPSGKHEVTTVLQRVGLADRIRLEPAAGLAVYGFEGDMIVREALSRLAAAAGAEPAWSVTIDKHIPVAAGLGGGSSDAAAALLLANETLDRPLPRERLHRLAAELGADVPFFLTEGPQLGEGDGSDLRCLDLPQAFVVLLLVPETAGKESTAAVYGAFDARGGAAGYETRRAALLGALSAGDLGGLPPNDLAGAPEAEELRQLGAFRADVSGAGPTVYALFAEPEVAEAAGVAMAGRGRVWIVPPAW